MEPQETGPNGPYVPKLAEMDTKSENDLATAPSLQMVAKIVKVKS